MEPVTSCLLKLFFTLKTLSELCACVNGDDEGGTKLANRWKIEHSVFVLLVNIVCRCIFRETLEVLCPAPAVDHSWQEW